MPFYDGVYKVVVVDGNTFYYEISHIPENTAQVDLSNMGWAKVLAQHEDYYRYNQQTATGSAFPGYGQLVLHASAEAVIGFDEGYKGLVTSSLDATVNNEFLSDDSGLIVVYTYYSTTNATATVAGGVKDYRWQTKVKNGEKFAGSTLLNGGDLLDRRQYFVRAGSNGTTNPLANFISYSQLGGNGEERTEYEYTWFGSTTRVESVTTKYPTATTAQNGPNSSDTETVVYDSYGRPTWKRDGDGFIHYTKYDTETGAVIRTIMDVNTSLTTTFSSLQQVGARPLVVVFISRIALK